MRHTVEITETADQLADFATVEEAEAYIEAEEMKDWRNDEYTEGFYSIRNNETDECEVFNK